MDTPTTPFRSQPSPELQALEDPRVTEAFVQLERAQTRRAYRNPLKVRHVVVICVVLALLPALAVWALNPGA